MKKLLITIPVAFLATALIAGEMKQGGEHTSSKLEKQFNALDTNGDGNLSRQEADKASTLKQRFAEADVDASGTIEISEYVLHETQEATAAGMNPEAEEEFMQ